MEEIKSFTLGLKSFNKNAAENIESFTVDVDFDGAKFKCLFDVRFYCEKLVRSLSVNEYGCISVKVEKPPYDEQFSFTRYSENKSIRWMNCQLEFVGSASELKSKIDAIATEFLSIVEKGRRNLDLEIEEIISAFRL